MVKGILIDGDPSHEHWIHIALEYVPSEVQKSEFENLAIIGLGRVGGCRLPKRYREREVVLLSDWVFPPAGQSEGDDSGRFFIVTLLHEIVHAVRKHKSPRLDSLSHSQIQDQEAEADEVAVNWFNLYVNASSNRFMKSISVAEFREIVDRYANIPDAIEEFKSNWHS